MSLFLLGNTFFQFRQNPESGFFIKAICLMGSSYILINKESSYFFSGYFNRVKNVRKTNFFKLELENYRLFFKL